MPQYYRQGLLRQRNTDSIAAEASAGSSIGRGERRRICDPDRHATEGGRTSTDLRRGERRRLRETNRGPAECGGVCDLSRSRTPGTSTNVGCGERWRLWHSLLNL